MIYYFVNIRVFNFVTFVDKSLYNILNIILILKLLKLYIYLTFFL